MTTSEPHQHAALLAPTLADVADLLSAADLRADVQGCPGWDVLGLTAHLGGIYQWASAALHTADPEAGPPAVEPDPAPDDAHERQALLAWFRRHADALLEALEAAGGDTPAWGFGPPPRTSAFWWRRMVHETTLHHWDLRASQGGPELAVPPTTVSDDPAVALDGIDEVATMFFPRQVRLGRCDPLERPVRLLPQEVAVDDGTGWLLGGDGRAGDDTGTAQPAAATLRGPADAVLLAVWGRVPLEDERLLVEGDADAMRQALLSPIVP